jgi:hypothetical protein
MDNIEKIENTITNMLESRNHTRGLEFKFERCMESENMTRLTIANVRLISPRDLADSLNRALEIADFGISELRQTAHLGGYLEITATPPPPPPDSFL